jgi:hypothetical protein
MEGFIGAVLGSAGKHMFTITAWEHRDNPRQFMKKGAHKQAVDRFFGPDFTAGGVTTVWVPERINTMWVRCGECAEMSSADAESGQCRNGHGLPERPSYW